MLPSQSPAIFTVSRLNQTVRLLPEREMGQIWINGEVSNFSRLSSGHWCFTLKDDNVQMHCAMFRNSNCRVTFHPQHGQQVLARVNIILYESRSDHQVIAKNMQPADEGLLQQKYEQPKAQLTAKELFEQKHKQAPPSPAHCVGVITSKTGTALHDTLHVLRRHDPGPPMIIYPTAIQGDDAPRQIVRIIALVNARQGCDVLTVGRGGDSLEGLWSFNDERVTRAIFTSQISIISTVSHGTDITAADFVADLRTLTPSAAAEIISRNQQELLRQLQSEQQRLEMAMDYFLANHQHRFTQLLHRLRQQCPQLRLTRQQTALGRLRQWIRIAARSRLKRAEQRQKRTVQRLDRYSPQPRIHRAQSRIQQLEYRLAENMRGHLSERCERFGSTVIHLEAVSSLATLTRGYSVTSVSDGTVLRQTKQVKTGGLLTTRLKDGWVESGVEQIAPVKKTQTRKPSPAKPAE